jgi:hypothetical protein
MDGLNRQLIHAIGAIKQVSFDPAFFGLIQKGMPVIPHHVANFSAADFFHFSNPSPVLLPRPKAS